MNGAKLRDSVHIARIEWIRHRRELDRSWPRRWLRLVAGLVGIALGAVAYSIGRDLTSTGTETGAATITIVVAAFVGVVLRSSALTHARFEQLHSDMLLTTVTAPTAALGLHLFVFARVAAVLAVPAVAVAVGGALGIGSPAAAITIVVAVAWASAFAVGIGVAGRLAVQLVGMRIARGRFYRDVLFVFGWTALVVTVILLGDRVVSVVALDAWDDLPSPAWLVDLAFLGAGDRTNVEARRALTTFGVLSLAIPAFVATGTVLARRIWEREPASSTRTAGSHSFVETGPLERMLEGRVSEPTLTVARGRLLVERRVPRGLLSTAYVLVFVVFVVLPAFSIVGVPLLLLVAFAFGLAAGVVVGSEPVGVHYRALPMLLTTVGGPQFVGGHVLAATAVGVPLISIVVAPIGVASPASIVETTALVLFGVAVCVCTTAVVLAVELDVDRDELVPVPFFFTDTPVYAQMGRGSFLRLGGLFAGVTIVVSPAFVGNVSAVYERVATVGVPAAAVRIGSLGLAILAAAVVSAAAYRIAIRRYRLYRLS